MYKLEVRWRKTNEDFRRQHLFLTFCRRIRSLHCHVGNYCVRTLLPSSDVAGQWETS